MMNPFSYTMAAAMVGTCMVSTAMAEDWLTDLPTALKQAEAEGKAVLVDFTGSDWCGWCVRMRSTILDTPAFRSYAADKFVLMEVDVPKNVAKIGAELHAKNRALAARYSVTAYPTLLVLDTRGEVLGGFIGGRDALPYVTAPLDEALSNKKRLEEARKLQGEAKAQALYAVYSTMQPELRKLCRALRDEIAAADADNTTGIHDEIRDSAKMEQLQADLAAIGMNFEQGNARIDREWAEASEANKPLIRKLRMEYLERSRDHIITHANSTDDVLKLKQLLLLMAEYASPQEAADLRREIEAQFAEPEQVLRMLRAKQKP